MGSFPIGIWLAGIAHWQPCRQLDEGSRSGIREEPLVQLQRRPESVTYLIAGADTGAQSTTAVPQEGRRPAGLHLST